MPLWRVPDVARLNHAALSRALDWLVARQPLARPRVLLISPNRHDVLFVRQRLPAAALTIVTIADWNLDQAPALTVGPFDWALASNVLHYASAPRQWIAHLLMASPVLVIQDLVDRRRGPEPPYLAGDGDRMRYRHPAAGIESPFVGAFDLGTLEPPPAYCEAFEGARNDLHIGLAAPVHFCAVLLGSTASAPRPLPPPRPGQARRRALSVWGYRLRLLCFEHLPLYVLYKGAQRLWSAWARSPTIQRR